MMSDPRSPADVLADEYLALQDVPTARAPLLRALAPLADSSLPDLRHGVARVYATLPLDPRKPAGPQTLEAVRELVEALGVRFH